MRNPYAIDLSMVRHIAKLAALDLSPAEETLFLKDLNQILEHMKQLQSCDTESLEAALQNFPAANVTREDVVHPSLSQGEVLQNAPERESAFFKTPPILETEL